MNPKIFAPDEYWQMPPDALNEIAQGCGPGKFGDFLVPDTIYFLSIRPACKVHDYMYFLGETIEDKWEADRVFENNMIRIVKAASGFWLLRWLRLRRVRVYYMAVKHLGGPAFWNGKNPPGTERSVFAGLSGLPSLF